MAKEIYIADLERHWLEAESKADELKLEVERNGTADVQALFDEAERAASEAFDRLWQARDAGRTTEITGHQMVAK